MVTIKRVRTLSPINDHPGDSLTERQTEILCLVADGWEGQAIADILTISERTVRTHMSDILKKMGARNRTDAVRIGREIGVIGDGLRPMYYGHRNGEDEPPTIAEDFWMEIPKPLARDFVRIAVAPWGEWRMKRFQGDWEAYQPDKWKKMGVRWWGPLRTPWDK